MQDIVQNSNRLTEQVKAVCPIVSLVILSNWDPASVVIQFAATATAAQVAAAQAIVAGFDPSDAAATTYYTNKNIDLSNLQFAAANAIAAINAYLAIPTPTAAQVAAEVRAIDQRQKQVIQALVRIVANILS